jgi:membrane-bound lytic murein transglycosylase A
MPKSHWQPVAWRDLPGWPDQALHEAWNAWVHSCERPQTAWAALCSEVRLLSIGTQAQQSDWIEQRLQPYRVVDPQGATEGLLTGYFEPQLDARRQPGAGFQIPLYSPPPDLGQRRPWYSRQEIDTLPEAQAALRDRQIAYLENPVDALILQIQGSGRLLLQEQNGQRLWVRLAFAGHNDLPYRSVGRWLLDQGLVRDASWPGIKQWIAQNPQRLQELLWSNPRMVFFQEQPLSDYEARLGPRGAQGVLLTPGRSIAVDPASIPYGTPVWLATRGPLMQLNRLVLAQDTGGAIQGAVRADFFAGWGPEAAELAGRLRQPLELWVLWPRIQ